MTWFRISLPRYGSPAKALQRSGISVPYIKIKWDEGASFDEKLERIITQKWIAIYPDGQEAWSEFRRTGYPKLWPVNVNLSGGDVPEGEFIKRINYPPAITNASQAATAAAVGQLPGWQG